MVKICATSDLHGYLPEIPPCDVFLLAGDVVPAHNHKLAFQRNWILEEFRPWLEKVKERSGAQHMFMCWGNHDHIGQEEPGIKYGLPIEVLTDELQEFVCNGDTWRIWGSPWTKRFFDWSFNMDPEPLAELHSKIPPCDIVITHGPAWGFGDLVYRKVGRKGNVHEVMERVGSPTLTKWIVDNDPKLVVFGHIHCDQCTRVLGESIIANVSYVDEKYRPYYPPQIFDMEVACHLER